MEKIERFREGVNILVNAGLTGLWSDEDEISVYAVAWEGRDPPQPSEADCKRLRELGWSNIASDEYPDWRFSP